jgi:hypothetical protein
MGVLCPAIMNRQNQVFSFVLIRRDAGRGTRDSEFTHRGFVPQLSRNPPSQNLYPSLRKLLHLHRPAVTSVTRVTRIGAATIYRVRESTPYWLQLGTFLSRDGVAPTMFTFT